MSVFSRRSSTRGATEKGGGKGGKGGAEIKSVSCVTHESCCEKKVSLLTVFHRRTFPDASQGFSFTPGLSRVRFFSPPSQLSSRGEVYPARAAPVTSLRCVARRKPGCEPELNHEHVRHHVSDQLDCHRSFRFGASNDTTDSSRHNRDSGANNSRPDEHRLCSYRSGYCAHPADCSCSGLPALSVSLPQQRRLQDNRGAGSRRGPRRGAQQPGCERKEGILHLKLVKTLQKEVSVED